MSAKIMGKVWELELPANKLIVLLAMADHADHDGNNIFPSIELIAWKTGYSEKQARRIIQALEKDGLLTCDKRSGGRHPSTYSIHFEKGKMKAPRPSKPGHNDQVDYAQPSQNDPVQPGQHGSVEKTNPDILTSQPGHLGGVNPDMPSLKSAANRIEPNITINATDVASVSESEAKRHISERHTTPASIMNPIKDAIVAAFEWKWDTMTRSAKGQVQVAAKELCEVGMNPERVASLYLYTKAKCKTFGPRALCTQHPHWVKSHLTAIPSAPIEAASVISPMDRLEQAAVLSEENPA